MTDKVNHVASTKLRLAAVILALASLSGFPAVAAKSKDAPVVAPRPDYARVADLVTSSKAIAVVAIKKMTNISADRAPGLAPGKQRFLVQADTLSLIRGNDVLARQASFLLDLPGAPKSKPPKWKGRSFLTFGAVEQRVDFFQLLSSDAIIAWSPENEAMVRKVDAELSASSAPPVIQGVDSVFHVTGAVAGEGETQIFLVTGDGSPISLSIVRKPDESPLFGVSLGEIVDEAAALPAPETPLWYRLACSLPDGLPASALAGQSAAEGAEATRDYRAFLDALAPCRRAPQPIE